MIETTYIMVKPGFANNPEIIKEVKDRIKGLNLEIMDEGYVKYDVAHSRKHYAEHVEKPFYPELEEYITSDKAYGMVVVGKNAIMGFKSIAGGVKDLQPGTIRYDIPHQFGIPCDTTKNVVHSSGKPEEAEKEIDIFSELKTLYKNDDKELQ